MIHGTKKTKKTKSQQQAKADNQMSLKISKHLHEFMQLRNKQKQDLTYLTQFTDILMQLCSDIPTIYNFRRQLVEQQLSKLSQADQKRKLLQSNLKLTTKLLKGDPKSYCIWSFRQWLVSQLFQLPPNQVLLAELQLCKYMLTKDEKNFHVWNYRHWLNSLSVDIDTAIEFVHSKIKTNPFNFSPYHFLTKHLPQKYQKMLEQERSDEILQFGMDRKVFDEELEMVRTAMFLNPQEEAPWNFYKWLVKVTVPCRVLRVQMKEPNKYEIVTSFNTANIATSVRVNGKEDGFRVTSPTGTEPSSTWILELTSNEEQPKIQVLSNFELTSKYIKTEYGYFFIGTKQQSDKVSSSLKILQDQITFVQQVLASQQGKCRFASLQLLQLNRLTLHFVPSLSEWQSTCSSSQQQLSNLSTFSKGQRYIKYQESLWESLRSRTPQQLQQQLLMQRLH